MVSASIWHASLALGFQWSIVVNGLDTNCCAESELRNLIVTLHGGLTLHMVLRETITRLAVSMSVSSYSQRASSFVVATNSTNKSLISEHTDLNTVLTKRFRSTVETTCINLKVYTLALIVDSHTASETHFVSTQVSKTKVLTLRRLWISVQNNKSTILNAYSVLLMRVNRPKISNTKKHVSQHLALEAGELRRCLPSAADGGLFLLAAQLELWRLPQAQPRVLIIDADDVDEVPRPVVRGDELGLRATRLANEDAEGVETAPAHLPQQAHREPLGPGLRLEGPNSEAPAQPHESLPADLSFQRLHVLLVLRPRPLAEHRALGDVLSARDPFQESHSFWVLKGILDFRHRSGGTGRGSSVRCPVQPSDPSADRIESGARRGGFCERSGTRFYNLRQEWVGPGWARVRCLGGLCTVGGGPAPCLAQHLLKEFRYDTVVGRQICPSASVSIEYVRVSHRTRCSLRRTTFSDSAQCRLVGLVKQTMDLLRRRYILVAAPRRDLLDASSPCGSVSAGSFGGKSGYRARKILYVSC